MALVSYETEQDPSEMGVYACRVPMRDVPGFYEDKFLCWDAFGWHYPSSDQKYRGEVVGWIGPLQRHMNVVAVYGKVKP